MLYPNYRLPNDGFRLISTLLRNEGHDIKIITIFKGYPNDISDNELELLRAFIMEADLLMLGVYSTHEYYARRLTKYFKKISPEKLVIWGGPHCKSAPENALKYADGICYNEGEIAVPLFVRLLEAGDVAYLQTPNMAFNINGAIQKNPALPRNKDLGSNPFYDYSFKNEWVLDNSLFPVSKEVFDNYFPIYPFNKPTVLISSDRDCPYHCSYCHNSISNKLYPQVKNRRLSIQRLIAEIENTIRQLPDIKHISISDDDFFSRSAQEIHEFVTLYNKNTGLPCAFNVSANNYSKDKLLEMLKLDSFILLMGVQSASQNVLDNIYERNIPIAKAKKAIEEMTPFLKKGNFKLLCDFIIDNPYENKSDIIETYKFIAHLDKKIYLSIFTLTFFPGTPLYDRALKDKLISSDNEELEGRSIISKEIKYQINYPMLLMLIWEARKFKRNLPVWVLLLPVNRFVTALMSCIPRRMMAWMIRKTGNYIYKHFVTITRYNKF